MGSDEGLHVERFPKVTGSETLPTNKVFVGAEEFHVKAAKAL